MTFDESLSVATPLRRAMDRHPFQPLPPRLAGREDSLRADVLVRVLDEIGWGVLVLDARHAVRYANPTARRALGKAVMLQGDRLVAVHREDQEPLRRALGRAADGLRTMLTLAAPGAETIAAVISLARTPAAPDEGEILVLLSRPSAVDPLVIQLFACSHALTDSESRVLSLLCKGSCPTAIADELGVAITTVRTQLGAIRSKTRTANLRELVQRIAQLPPMTSLPRIGL